MCPWGFLEYWEGRWGGLGIPAMRGSRCGGTGGFQDIHGSGFWDGGFGFGLDLGSGGVLWLGLRVQFGNGAGLF